MGGFGGGLVWMWWCLGVDVVVIWFRRGCGGGGVGLVVDVVWMFLVSGKKKMIEKKGGF